jgi:hypothetical protein
MRQAMLAAAVAAFVIVLAACSSSSSSSSPATNATHSSSSPSAMTGTETLKAELTGSAAAQNLNSNSNAAPVFPAGTWTGPVAVVLKPLKLGNGGNKAGTVSWATSLGTATVYHSANTVGQNASLVWTKVGNACHFAAVFSKGTFHYVPAQSTGKWASLSGSGVYTITAQGVAPLNSGKTTCSNNTTGNVENGGARVSFLAVAPVTVKP